MGMTHNYLAEEEAASHRAESEKPVVVEH